MGFLQKMFGPKIPKLSPSVKEDVRKFKHLSSQIYGSRYFYNNPYEIPPEHKIKDILDKKERQDRGIFCVSDFDDEYRNPGITELMDKGFITLKRHNDFGMYLCDYTLSYYHSENVAQATNSLPPNCMLYLAQRFIDNKVMRTLFLSVPGPYPNEKDDLTDLNNSHSIQRMLDKVNIDQKPELIETLTKHNIGRTLLGRCPYHYAYIACSLSRGLNPKEFETLLTDTGFMANINKQTFHDDDYVYYIDFIAAKALSIFYPQNLIPESERRALSLYAHVGDRWTIEDMCTDQGIIDDCKSYAKEIYRIALNHCIGAKEPAPDTGMAP